jgi:hypothetical protein
MRQGLAVVAGFILLASAPWAAAESRGRDLRPVDAEVADVLTLIGPMMDALGGTEARAQDGSRLLIDALRSGQMDTAAWASVVRWVLFEKEERVAAGFARALETIVLPGSGPDAERWNATAQAMLGAFAAVLQDAESFHRQDGDAIVRSLVGVAAPAVAAALAEADPRALESARAVVQAFAPSAARDMVGPLLAGLAHSEPAVRLGAVTALGALGPSARVAVPRLRAALDDPDAEVRDAAARALARIQPE